MTAKKEALKYLRAGVSVIPVAFVDDGAGHEKKVPVAKNPQGVSTWKEYQDRLPTEAEVEEWFSRNGRVLGAVTGYLSGCIVIDAEDQGAAEDISKTYGIPLTEGAVSRTGRGGYHFWFKYPKVLPDRCTGIKTVARWKNNVDVRGDGGYAVLPPSAHKDRTYRWVGEEPTEFLDLPLALLRDLPKRTNSPFDADIEQGSRDTDLTSVVGRMFGLGMKYADVLPLAIAHNMVHCKPPLPESDVRKITESIYRAEAGKPKNKDRKQDDDVPAEFRLLNFKEMYEKYATDTTEWLVKDMLPDKTTGLVIAPPGMFKTWLLVDLAVSLATGKKLLDTFKVMRTGPVIVVQQEDAFHMLLARFAQVIKLRPVVVEPDGSWVIEAFDTSIPIYFHPDRALRFDQPRVVDAFIEQIQTVRPILSMVDPLYSAADTDDYMAKAAKEMMFMKVLRDEIDTSFIVAHHSSKGKGNDPEEGTRQRDSIWGSQLLNAWQETGWQTRLVQDAQITLFRNFKGSAPVEPLNVEFNIDDLSCRISVGDKDIELEERLILFIHNNKVTSLTQMMQHLAISSKATASRLCARVGAEKDGDFYAIKNK